MTVSSPQLVFTLSFKFSFDWYITWYIFPENGFWPLVIGQRSTWVLQTNSYIFSQEILGIPKITIPRLDATDTWIVSLVRYQITSRGSLIIFSAKYQQLYVCVAENRLNKKTQSSSPFLVKSAQGKTCKLYFLLISKIPILQPEIISSFISLLWALPNKISFSLWPWLAFNTFLFGIENKGL